MLYSFTCALGTGQPGSMSPVPLGRNRACRISFERRR
jgi:hypothetical protein